MLNALHITAMEASGGAAKSAWSLHEGLLERNVDSRMLVGVKETASDVVRPIKRNLFWRVLDRPFGELTSRVGLQDAFLPSSFGVARDPWFTRADVLQLHNLHVSFFSFSAIPFLSRRRPTVWWIQDMWPITGHVAYSYDCERWRTGCGSCPYLHEYPPLAHDGSAVLWRLKRRAYARSRLTLVASSRWLASLLAESPLLGGFDCRVIPNGVDTSFFRPVARDAARAELGLGLVEGPVVLVFDGEKRKGAELLPAIFHRLAEKGIKATVLVAGRHGPWRVREPLALIDLGVIADARRLATAYAAADVFLFPTLADNLPNAVLESLACGTPVVTTPVGGLPDAVHHLENGYVTESITAADLAEGVRVMLEDPQRGERAGAAARGTAERDYREGLQADRFADLYAEVVEAAR